jgi:hypothetical protein
MRARFLDLESQGSGDFSHKFLQYNFLTRFQDRDFNKTCSVVNITISTNALFPSLTMSYVI